MNAIVESVMSIFYNTPRYGEWISIDDRHPELNQVVIIWDGYLMDIDRYVGTDGGIPIWADGKCRVGQYSSDYPQVLAWMPTPERPKN